MALVYSYNINFNTKESIGSNSSSYEEQEVNFILQSNNSYIDNCKSAKLSYKLGANQTITVSLANLGVKFLKSVCIKATNQIRFTYTDQIIKGTNLFIDNKIPTTVPTVVENTTISIQNISTEISEVTLLLVILV
jgi:hypothetical protein